MRTIIASLVWTLGLAFLVSGNVLVAAPTVTTRAATSPTPGGATLNGTAINYNDLGTRAWFEYGLTTDYGSVSGKRSLNTYTSTNVVNYSNTVSGLLVATEYHFRAVATNSTGTSYGDDFTFTTSPATAPTLLTNYADAPDTTNVVVHGKLNANGLETAAWFEWGLTTSYGNATPLLALSGGTTNQIFNASIDGLNIGTPYYFRAVASNSLGTVYGVGQRFVTAFFANGGTIPGGLPGVNTSSQIWGDYDNDGLLDYMVVGASYTRVTQIWHNTGSGFEDVTGSVAPDVPQGAFGAAAWGDYDNDGRLDFILAGEVPVNGFQRPYTQIWHNTGSNFVDVTATIAPGIPQVDIPALAWGDYDNDGRLDLLLTGGQFNAGAGTSQIWHNTGSNLVEVTATVAPDLTQVAWGSVTWGDYDNDGWLDFILSGALLNNTSACQIWHNTGSNFVNVTATVASDLPQGQFISIAWGDYDNDGLLDFVLTAGGPQIWHNTGSNFVNESSAFALGNPTAGSSTWVDYDHDGRLDLLLDNSKIWRNGLTPSNSPPTAPTGLALTLSAQGAMFSWHAATDAQTPASGLTYAVRAGTTPGGVDLLAPEADAVSGFRAVPVAGNAQGRLFMPLAGVTNGQTIYWSVQAVDGAYAGSPFAAETSLVSMPVLSLATNTAGNVSVSWQPPTWGWHLQEASGLTPGAWSDSPLGEVNPALIPATNQVKFYRLFNP